MHVPDNKKRKKSFFRIAAIVLLVTMTYLGGTPQEAKASSLSFISDPLKQVGTVYKGLGEQTITTYKNDTATVLDSIESFFSSLFNHKTTTATTTVVAAPSVSYTPPEKKTYSTYTPPPTPTEPLKNSSTASTYTQTKIEYIPEQEPAPVANNGITEAELEQRLSTFASTLPQPQNTTCYITQAGGGASFYGGVSQSDISNLQNEITTIQNNSTSTGGTVSDAHIKSLFSASSPLAYNSSTGVFSTASGYSIPLTASSTQWSSFYNTPSTRITAGTNLCWSGNTLNVCGISGGLSNNATGTNAIALGYLTTAGGNCAIALGVCDSANVCCSAAIGMKNITSGFLSSAFGAFNCSIGADSSAFGFQNKSCSAYSSAFGYRSTASGCNSSALGYCDTSSGLLSSAFGARSTASGCYSSAFGLRNTASGYYSSAFGSGITNSCANSVEIGADNSNKLHIDDNGVNFITSGSGGFCVNGTPVGGGGGGASGCCNTESGSYAFASGNYDSACGNIATAVGYDNNACCCSSAFGIFNTASGYNASASGYNNTASGNYSSAFGKGNSASGYYSSALGANNTTSGYFSSSVGFCNNASGCYSSAFGYCNTASGPLSSAFGLDNIACGNISTAFGTNLCNTTACSAMFGGNYTIGVEGINSTHAYMLISPSGVNFCVSGTISQNGGAPSFASDRALKENFTDVDKQSILDKINALPMQQWDYIAQGPTVKHIAPIAQDFYAAFGLNNSTTSISAIDPAGIALVGIQALSQRLDALEGSSTFASMTIPYDSLTASTSDDSVFSTLKSFGAEVVDGVAYLKDVWVERLHVGSLEIKNPTDVHQTGFTIYDRATGQPICVYFENGVQETSSGDCDDATTTSPSNSVVTPENQNPQQDTSSTSTDTNASSTTENTGDTNATSSDATSTDIVVPQTQSTSTEPVEIASSTPTQTSPSTPTEPSGTSTSQQ